jgi:hypothetical protein
MVQIKEDMVMKTFTAIKAFRGIIVPNVERKTFSLALFYVFSTYYIIQMFFLDLLAIVTLVPMIILFVLYVAGPGLVGRDIEHHIDKLLSMTRDLISFLSRPRCTMILGGLSTISWSVRSARETFAGRAYIYIPEVLGVIYPLIVITFILTAAYLTWSRLILGVKAP